MRIGGVLLAILLAMAGSAVAAHGENASAEPAPQGRAVASEFRPGVEVEFLYTQDIEGVYTTAWLGREETRKGSWREIYFETSEKYVSKGILSFQCFAEDTNGDPTIGIVEYGSGEFGDPAAKRVIRIAYAQRQTWMYGELDALRGKRPPYELFVVSHYRFCGEAARVHDV